MAGTSSRIPWRRAVAAPLTTTAPATRRRLGSAASRLAAVPTPTTTTAAHTLRPARPVRPATRPPHLGGCRWTSEAATGSKIWSFEEIQKRPAGTTVVDVREPGEVRATGRIPGAVNIPITTSPDAFHLGADEFEDRFDFARPPPDADVVFYCKAGVRSRAAAALAREAGWARVGEYPGSWVDWAAKGGEIER